jgi:hypothetical protein
VPVAETFRTPPSRRSAPGLAAALLLAAVALPCAAQPLGKCIAGERVIDREGRIGTIVSQGNALCRVRYDNGETYGWIYRNLRPALGAMQPEPPAANAVPPQPPNNAAQAAGVPAVTALRPTINHGHVYRAGPRRQFIVSAEVNGAAVSFSSIPGRTWFF